MPHQTKKSLDIVEAHSVWCNSYTHVVLSEFIDGDLRLHEVVIEDNDFPAEGSLFLFVVVGLQSKKKNRQKRKENKRMSEVDRVDEKRDRNVKG